MVKPDRKDYSLPKNYRPIALLETFGKLLEKVMAKRILADVTRNTLIPINQFGGRNTSSCTDAGLAPLHDVTLAHWANLKCGILLFDIRGFFDNVNHADTNTIRYLDECKAMSGTAWPQRLQKLRRVMPREQTHL
jgi:hypothetical protein